MNYYSRAADVNKQVLYLFSVLTLFVMGAGGGEGGGRVQCTLGVNFCRELLNARWF